MGRQYAAVSYASWPKDTSPQTQSVMHRLKMRSEVLLPEIFPNKRPKEPINPHQRVLYDISEPMSDIYGEEERLQSPSSSSAGTLQGDQSPSRVRRLTNEPSSPSPNGHGGRSCLSNGMKRKKPGSDVSDTEVLPSSPPVLPNYAANDARKGSELPEKEFDTSERSDWDQPYRETIRSDKRRRYGSGIDYWRSSTQRSPTRRSSTQRSSTQQSSTQQSSTQQSSTQQSSSPEGKDGSQSPRYMMSGALAEGDPNTSSLPLPLDMCVHDKVTSGPDCLCTSVPTGAEKYHGHC